MRPTRAFSCFALTCSLACAPDDEFPLPPIVWEGETVRVRMDDETIPVCGGTFDALDLHASLVRDAMLLDGRDRIIDYSIGDEVFVDQMCMGDPIACTDSRTGRVYTSKPFCQHEVVHSVRFLDSGTRLLSSPIEEGLATLFGADLLGSGTIPLEAAEILEKDSVVGGSDYYRAGRVMAFLVARHGIQAFRDFDLLARTEEEDGAFLQVFGETKEQLAEAAEAAPQCESSQWWTPLLECSGDPLLVDADTGRIVLEGELRCGEADVQGPTFGMMWTSRHFRLTEKTFDLLYEIEMPEDSTLEIVGCQSGCPERFAYSGGPSDVGGVTRGIPSLEPGEYFLRMSRPVSDGDGHFEIVL